MKRPLLLLASFFLAGCVSSIYPTHREYPSFSDFRPYTENGFFISPGMDGVKYKPIGVIKYTFIPGVVTKSKQHNQYQEFMSGSNGDNPISVDSLSMKEGEFFQPKEDYMLARVVHIAKLLGATGLLNYRIDYDFDIPSPISQLLDSGPYTTVMAHPKQTYGCAVVSAFAVEILNK